MSIKALRGACAPAVIAMLLLVTQLAYPAAAESKTGNRRLLQYGGRDDYRWQQGGNRLSSQDWQTVAGQAAALATRPAWAGSIPGAGASAAGTASANAAPGNRFGNRFGNPAASTATSTAAADAQGSTPWWQQGSRGSTATATGTATAGRDNRYWQNSLQSRVQPSLTRARGVRRQRVAPTTAQATAVATSLGSGNAVAAAQSIAVAADQNPQYAAEGIVSAVATAEASSSGGNSVAVATAEAITSTIDARPNRAGAVLAQSASLAYTRGYGSAYSKTMAQAFRTSRRRRRMPQFTKAVTQAIATGDDNAKVAFGEAIAQAVASGGDGQAAVAEATATAFCSGGSSAEAWASAYAVALSQDSRGCLVLNEARAMAEASCGGGQFKSNAQSEATSTVLGFCGLLPNGFLPQGLGGWSTSMGGSRATPGAIASGSGSGSTYGK